jgi:hypothetical protein
MVKRILLMMVLLLGGASLLWAGTVTVDGILQGTLQSMSVDQSGNIDIVCDSGSNCGEQVLVTPSTLSFTVNVGQTTNPPQQVVSVKDGCTPAVGLAFTVTGTSQPWVLATPTSGNGTLNVTVSAAQITQSASATITMNVQGATGTVQRTVTVNVTYTDPSQITAPLLVADDVNMLYGEAKGIQTVDVGKEKYYKFVLPSQCNRVTVTWTTFDWVGKVDMLVKAGSPPTLTEYNQAVSSGYPATSSGPSIWYNLSALSGDGGETVTMSYVPAGTYYIMMKNTHTAQSKFKVSYKPNCTYVPR